MLPVFLCLMFASAALSEDAWVGKKFMSRMDAKVMNGSREISSKDLSWPLIVREVKGDWLDVGPGFIRKADVVPLQDAPAYYTDYLRIHDDSISAYSRRAI